MRTDTETRLARLEGVVTAKLTGNQDLKNRVGRLEQFALQSLTALEGLAPGDTVTALSMALEGVRIQGGNAACDVLATRVEYLEDYAREWLRQLTRISTENTVATLKEALGPALTAENGTPGTPTDGDAQ